MAGLLQYQGSEIPESVRRAAQFELDARKAQQSRLPLSVEGSGIPESVRKAAQNAIEKGAMPRIPNAPVEAPGGWADGARNLSAADAKALLTKGGSLLGQAGKAAGGIGAVYELGRRLNNAYGTGAWDRAQDLVQRRETRLAREADPGLASRGQDTVNRITDNAMLGSRGVMEPTGAVTLKPTGGVRGLMDQARESGRVQKPSEAPKAPQGIPMEPEKVAAVESVAAAAPEVEAGRKRLQRGALQGLQSGEVHVSDLAKSVVEADEQRAGTPMKSEEKAQAVTAEIAAMKTMDKAQLSEYVSYALIAGGLLASVLDKSGQTGQAFHQSLNAQLDRNLAAGKMQATIANNAAKLALEERKVGNTEKDTASKIESRGSTAEYQKGSLAVAEKNAGVNQQNADTRSRSAAVAERQGAARLGLMGEANQLKREGLNLRVRAQDFKEANGGSPGAKMTTKDSSAAVDAWSKEKGVKLPEDVRVDMAQALRNTVQNPATKDYAISDILDELQTNYTTESQPWYKLGDTRVRRTKE